MLRENERKLAQTDWEEREALVGNLARSPN